jgi:hypothetical protein
MDWMVSGYGVGVEVAVGVSVAVEVYVGAGVSVDGAVGVRVAVDGKLPTSATGTGCGLPPQAEIAMVTSVSTIHNRERVDFIK